MKSIIISTNNSSSSWRNDAALNDFIRDFDESASEVWEKRFWNSSKCSSVDEWLNIMRFIWKEDWMNDDAWWLKKKDVWSEIQSSIKKMRFVYWLIDWFFSKQRRFFIIESIDRFDSWAIHEYSLL